MGWGLFRGGNGLANLRSDRVRRCVAESASAFVYFSRCRLVWSRSDYRAADHRSFVLQSSFRPPTPHSGTHQKRRIVFKCILDHLIPWIAFGEELSKEESRSPKSHPTHFTPCTFLCLAARSAESSLTVPIELEILVLWHTARKSLRTGTLL